MSLPARRNVPKGPVRAPPHWYVQSTSPTPQTLSLCIHLLKIAEYIFYLGLGDPYAGIVNFDPNLATPPMATDKDGTTVDPGTPDQVTKQPH